MADTFPHPINTFDVIVVGGGVAGVSAAVTAARQGASVFLIEKTVNLGGDNYFHIRYPEQNLDRCRTQFKLVADMEDKWAQMHEIVKELS